jgi:alkylhydroperoxidase family enzyme
MNGSRVWAHLPAEVDALFALMGRAKSIAALSKRQRAIRVTATASTMGDSDCSLAWGQKLSTAADPDLAASVLAGTDTALTPPEHALAAWARRVASDPNATTESDLDGLRDAGYDDPQILAITLFISLRLAFSTVNDALGALPDRALHDAVPPQVRDVVTWGRPAEE